MAESLGLRVCLAVLAAGESRRMGVCKLSMPVGGTTLLGRALSAACDSQADEVVVVTGCHRDELAGIVSYAARRLVRELHNDRWEQGQGTSVALAAGHAQGHGFDALLVMVADQPFVSSKHLDALIERFYRAREWDAEQEGANVKRPAPAAWRASCRGRRGNPCLFDRTCFEALMRLEGDEGARALFRARPDLVVEGVEFDDPRLFEDIDTPQDLERLDRPCAAGVRDGGR